MRKRRPASLVIINSNFDTREEAKQQIYNKNKKTDLPSSAHNSKAHEPGRKEVHFAETSDANGFNSETKLRKCGQNEYPEQSGDKLGGIVEREPLSEEEMTCVQEQRKKGEKQKTIQTFHVATKQYRPITRTQGRKGKEEAKTHKTLSEKKSRQEQSIGVAAMEATQTKSNCHTTSAKSTEKVGRTLQKRNKYCKTDAGSGRDEMVKPCSFQTDECNDAASCALLCPMHDSLAQPKTTASYTSPSSTRPLSNLLTGIKVDNSRNEAHRELRWKKSMEKAADSMHSTNTLNSPVSDSSIAKSSDRKCDDGELTPKTSSYLIQRALDGRKLSLVTCTPAAASPRLKYTFEFSIRDKPHQARQGYARSRLTSDSSIGHQVSPPLAKNRSSTPEGFNSIVFRYSERPLTCLEDTQCSYRSQTPREQAHHHAVGHYSKLPFICFACLNTGSRFAFKTNTELRIHQRFSKHGGGGTQQPQLLV